ncbi:hypothetical protein [Sideroxydans sp. CL21]|uniref:hypothetical protein n=1 Tax=Sideroxydans sp. CL21 TaxID=2600596 RepID=UPI0012A79512|nr:hypothetical protein [Sideroxydans sp. CL21]VVC85746.1 hypothetical protein [Sideroxydans sp. CL21]
MVGIEGVDGVSLFMGGEITASNAFVQTFVHSYRLKGKLLMGEFLRAGCRIADCREVPFLAGSRLFDKLGVNDRSSPKRTIINYS